MYFDFYFISFQDNEEEAIEIEDGEEVQEMLSPELITEDLVSVEETSTNGTSMDLIPGLQSSSEPDYNAMDNLTLLASLNIQEHCTSTENDLLLPGLGTD